MALQENVLPCDRKAWRVYLQRGRRTCGGAICMLLDGPSTLECAVNFDGCQRYLMGAACIC